MNLSPFPFRTLNWETVPKEEHAGITGKAFWQVVHMNEIRIRLVEYTPEYRADHWCHKGHILYCIEGEMETELEDGKKHILSAGMIYMVGDNSDPHRSYSKGGCKLLIVD